jgi:disulfide bond formation protein DsbB
MIGRIHGYPGLMLVMSTVVLVTVFAMQWLLGLQPCELCLLERWPWIIAAAMAVAGVASDRDWVRRALPLLVTLVFVLGSGLALYHIAVEKHWIAGPAACTVGPMTATTIDQLRAQLLDRQPVRCDEVSWSLFGVSLAGWNLCASIAMIGISGRAMLDADLRAVVRFARRHP